MNGVLVRVGVDASYGHWNAPVCSESGRFVYVPIPEKLGTPFNPGLERSYLEIVPSLERFSADLGANIQFPAGLQEHPMHLDPDFKTLTYGDQGARRGARMRDMKSGDLVVFYGGFRPIKPCKHRLIYALLGLYVVDEVVRADDVHESRWGENAHTRKLKRGTPDIVVRAKPRVSGRLENCITIGEWRDRAYRVTPELLKKWGGLSVQDGYIQRSAVPPAFSDPDRFYSWFLRQNVRLVARNN